VGAAVASCNAVLVRRYAPPGDHLRLETDEPRLLDLASRLWEERPDEDLFEGDMSFGVFGRRASDAAGSRDASSLERELGWTHGLEEFRCELPGLFEVRIDLAKARVEASASLHLLRNPRPLSFFPSLFTRYVLEAPAAVLLARRGWRALHAGAVTGPKGAVVVRGGSGAGKSTLVAAAHAAGLDVLGDESLLVSRADPDDLASSVRELTLREDSAALLGLLSRTEPAFSGGEEKRRVDLFAFSRPEARTARRASTLLLGPRVPGPARLVPLSPSEFLEEFARGEIPQEHLDGGAGAIARAWADAGGTRLDGASDLQGAVALLKTLVT
jgi:hypothetical protein